MPPTLQHSIAFAKAQYDKGLVFAARAIMIDAWETHQTSFEATMLLGKYHFEYGDIDGAIRAYARARNLNPMDAGASRALDKALKARAAKTSETHHPDTTRRDTAFCVTILCLLFVITVIMIGHSFGLSPILQLVAVGFVSVSGYVLWRYLVACAAPPMVDGEIKHRGRRPVVSYWRVFLPALGIGVALMLVMAFSFPGKAIIVALGLITLKFALGPAILIFAPGAREQYLLVDHPNAPRRSLFIKRMQGLSATEEQYFAIRMERVAIRQTFLQSLVGLWTLQLDISHDGLMGAHPVDLIAPEPIRHASLWRETVAAFITGSGTFIRSGATL